MNIGQVFTSIVAVLMIGSAISMVLSRNMIMSILSMVVTFLSLAVLYLTLNAQFLAVMQVVVYAGGIIVLFLFVIMLLNIEQVHRNLAGPNYKWLLAVALGVSFFAEIVVVVGSSSAGNLSSPSAHVVQMGTAEFIGKVLYTNYLFPFEIVSLLLLAGIVGALFLARKKLS